MKKKTRTLLDGRKVTEQKRSVKMIIDSKCPKKWLFVDMECCNVWRWKDNTFKWLGKEDVKTLNLIIKHLETEYVD